MAEPNKPSVANVLPDMSAKPQSSADQDQALSFTCEGCRPFNGQELCAKCKSQWTKQ